MSFCKHGRLGPCKACDWENRMSRIPGVKMGEATPERVMEAIAKQMGMTVDEAHWHFGTDGKRGGA